MKRVVTLALLITLTACGGGGGSARLRHPRPQAATRVIRAEMAAVAGRAAEVRPTPMTLAAWHQITLVSASAYPIGQTKT